LNPASPIAAHQPKERLDVEPGLSIPSALTQRTLKHLAHTGRRAESGLAATSRFGSRRERVARPPSARREVAALPGSPSSTTRPSASAPSAASAACRGPADAVDALLARLAGRRGRGRAHRNRRRNGLGIPRRGPL